jgi:metal-sulfur cluster biosynthetic enzyme
VPELPAWAPGRPRQVYDLFSCDKGIPVVDMGLVRSARVKEGMTRFVLLLPSGWCPIAANLFGQVADQIAGQPGTQTRLSPDTAAG